MKSLTRRGRACQAVQELEVVTDVDNHSEFVVSPEFLDSPLVVQELEAVIDDHKELIVSPEILDSPLITFRPSTPVNQLIPAWDAHPSKKLALSDSSSASSPNTSFDASLAATPATSFSDASSDYEVKHGQFTILSRSDSTCENGISHISLSTTSAPFNLNAASAITPVITPSSCIQCSLLQLLCSQTHPTCTRCTRRHKEPLGGFYGLLRVAEPCLARREQTVDEIKVLQQGLNSSRTKETTSVLCRLESDGDGDWERKLELANELGKEERERLERHNWILPEAAREVKSGAWNASEDE